MLRRKPCPLMLQFLIEILIKDDNIFPTGVLLFLVQNNLLSWQQDHLIMTDFSQHHFHLFLYI